MPTPRLARTHTPTLGHFTREEVLRLVGITPQQITRWERLRLVEPQAAQGRAEKVYTFADLVSLRTLKQLTGQGISETRLLDALQASPAAREELVPGAEARAQAVDLDGQRVDLCGAVALG